MGSILRWAWDVIRGLWGGHGGPPKPPAERALQPGKEE